VVTYGDSKKTFANWQLTVPTLPYPRRQPCCHAVCPGARTLVVQNKLIQIE
jgi:hypothetical protein